MRQLETKRVTTDFQSVGELMEHDTELSVASDHSDRMVKVMLWYCGGMVRDRRRELKMTQQELGSKVGMRTAFISKMEKGEVDLMLSSFIRILRVLDLRIDQHY